MSTRRGQAKISMQMKTFLLQRMHMSFYKFVLHHQIISSKHPDLTWVTTFFRSNNVEFNFLYVLSKYNNCTFLASKGNNVGT